MKFILNSFFLIYLRFKVTLLRLIEYFCEIKNYYSKFIFLKVDLSLLSLYIFQNPFRICKRFFIQEGKKEGHVYGETALFILETLATKCPITSKDLFFELGCGRARSCFWLALFTGCQVVGVEKVPAFIHKAQKIKAKFGLTSVEFRCEDFFSTDLSGGTIYYLYQTCLSEEEIAALIKRLIELPTTAKIVTVSYALNEFDRGKNQFVTVDQFEANFLWGKAQIFIQQRVGKVDKIAALSTVPFKD